MARRSAAFTILAVAVMVAAAAIGLFVVWPREKANPPAELVPSSWAEYRTSRGHELHVSEQRIECGACHDFRKSGFAPVELARCRGCHEQQATRTHHGGSMNTGCLTCHAFSPRASSTCKSCHTAERTTQSAPLVSVHASVGCDECHRVHQPLSPTSAECSKCHENISARHAGHVSSGACPDCHRPHEPAKAALGSCAGCHSQPKGPKPAGHDSCITCHAPHDFTGASFRVCAGCHAKQSVLVSAPTPEHRACTSCHKPHDPSATANSCAGCHKGVHVDHGRESACVRCHEPHGGRDDVTIAPCVSCHGKIAQSDTGAHAEGTACTACHAKHGFASVDRKTLCVGCHARELALVSANRAHEDCTRCHGRSVHEPHSAPACASCHQRESATAPSGHRACADCHDAHGATVPPLKSCASCHRKESTSKHGSLPGGCVACHRAHGDSQAPPRPLAAPTCVSCHAPKKLPGLHAVTGHLNCLKCHDAHGPPRDDRATCTGPCHADKREHEKEAAACSGCHVFAR